MHLIKFLSLIVFYKVHVLVNVLICLVLLRHKICITAGNFVPVHCRPLQQEIRLYAFWQQLHVVLMAVNR